MNKTELIDAMAADAGISKAAAKKALESFLGNVGGALKGGGRVSLVGFGSIMTFGESLVGVSFTHPVRINKIIPIEYFIQQ